MFSLYFIILCICFGSIYFSETNYGQRHVLAGHDLWSMIFLKTEIKAPRIISEQHILAHDVTELYLKRDFNATVISDQLT